MAIGESAQRVDAVSKVTGRARYTDDYLEPGMLVAKYFRSSIAHGQVKRLDTSKAAAIDGVEAIFTYEDIPKVKYATAGHPHSLDPKLADVADMYLLTDHVRYIGDEIAVVVAESDLIAEEAIGLIEVEYEEFEPLTTPDRIMASDALEIHEGSGNIAGKFQFECGGDLEKAFAEADQIHEAKYTTQMVQHVHIENHTAYAYMNDLQHIVVVSSTQIPHIVRRIVGQALEIPWSRVRVVKPYIGGGFGAKQDVILEPMVAFLTMKLNGRPVGLKLTREECMLCTRSRHPMELNVRIGAKKDGTLVARQVDVISVTGAYASHGNSIIAASGGKTCLLYPRMAIGFNGKTIYANIPIAGAMRAYGSPQMIFALESAIDELAGKLGIDPIEFRLKNGARTGDKNPKSNGIISSCGLTECIQKGKERIQWDAKLKEIPENQTGPRRRGLGIACFSYGTGTYPSNVEIAGARIILNQDGTVHIQTGATEIGQGSDTVVAQMAAKTIGLPTEKVHVVSTQDTDVTPFDTGAYASRQAYVVGNAVYKTATELKNKIIHFASQLLDISAHQLDLVDEWIVETHRQDKRLMSLPDLAMASYYHKEIGGQITADVSLKTLDNPPSFGCTLVDITVDLPLCQVYINEIVNVHDSGVILNHVTARGQVEGGMAMGIGAALSEQVLIDEKTGLVRNNNMLDYKVPTFTDIPEMGSDFVETIEPSASYGNKSLGEPPIITPPPAIRNAILAATGVAVNELPLSPQVLFKHFKAAGLI